MAQDILEIASAGANASESSVLPPEAAGPPFTSWCIFTVTGEDINPDQITLMLNLDPDRAVQGLPGRPGLWQLNSTLNAQARLEEHLQQLLLRLLPARQQLRRISRDARLEFFCAIEKRTDAQIEFLLPPQLILLIGYIGAHVVCEVSTADAMKARSTPPAR